MRKFYYIFYCVVTPKDNFLFGALQGPELGLSVPPGNRSLPGDPARVNFLKRRIQFCLRQSDLRALKIDFTPPTKPTIMFGFLGLF